MSGNLCLVLVLFLSQAFADDINAAFLNPIPYSTEVWELGTPQVIEWNITASSLTLLLYQWSPDTGTYASTYIFRKSLYLIFNPK